MKRFTIVLAAFMVFAAPLAVRAPAAAQGHSKLAPADEYFGRMKMSVLGIRNSLHDLGERAEYRPQNAASIAASLVLTEDALHDWESKYPEDTWLPRMRFGLAQVYQRLAIGEARMKTHVTAPWPNVRFPASPYIRIPGL